MEIRSEVEFRLGILRSVCEAVVETYGAGEDLAAALGGVYFAFKSVNFVYRIHDQLMSEPALLLLGNGDEAGYFAETMIRSLHSSGDLLARALVECGHATGSYISNLSYRDGCRADLGPLVGRLLGLPAWDYLSAFTNTAKHNAFINRTSVSADDDSQEILFEAFLYRDEPYERRSFTTVLAYATQVLDAELNILYWLLNHAPRSALSAPVVGPEQHTSITATFTPPRSSDYIQSKRYDVEESRD